ncbi:RNA pseudouridine synthase [Candidatus Parcubacteria bacterium]|jgi:23S rRNA pseudouridine1911/1915/1917 synthase|nr:MAG: RNA pseudouridine synthase [Candidatus Parcubacteria bacterium]
MDIKIIQETADYLVIDKPSGLLVHPAEHHEKAQTLVHWLIRKYPEIAEVGEDPGRPGLVHRLDMEVSGVMVIPKTQRMFLHLKKQFQAHAIKKIYLALVHGRPGKPEGVINFPLARSRRKKGRMSAQPQATEKTREAITRFYVLKKFQHLTLLEIEIETGRSNQIRAHLLAYGMPIVGDKVYRTKKVKQKVELDRPFLHSWKLEFADLNGLKKSFEARLPGELEKILNKIK